VPIPFAPLLGLALGAALARIAAPELSRDDGPIASSRSFVIVAAFAGLVWLPVVAYFLSFYGDWSYLYLVPWRRVPSAVDLGLVLVATLAVLAGFALAARPVRRRRSGTAWALMVVPAVLALGGVVAAAPRLAVSGTFAQFHGSFGTESIGASALGKSVALMGLVLALGVGWTGYSLTRLRIDRG
jgi:hypothetical protein